MRNATLKTKRTKSERLPENPVRVAKAMNTKRDGSEFWAEKTHYGKWVTVKTEYDLELTIDLEALVSDIAHRAIRNKSGVSKLAGGAIVLKRTGQRELSRSEECVPIPDGWAETQSEAKDHA